MKFPLVVFLTLSILPWGAFAASSPKPRLGGISGGGGDTTVADPVSQKQLTYLLEEFTAPVVLSWVKGNEQKYEDLAPEKRAASPWHKLFAGPKDVYSLLQNTKVELRGDRPCYDREGQERDGSIFADTKGAICLSTFLMAPKLSVADAPREAFALYLHEISHLLGTDEAEAVALQKLMLSDLVNADRGHIIATSQLAQGTWDMETTAWIHLMLRNPSQLNAKNIGELSEQFEKTYYEISDNVAFSVLRPQLRREFMPNRALLESLRDYLCLSDPYADAEYKKSCQEQTEKTFGAAAAVSAREFLLKRVDYKGNSMMFDPDLLGPEADQVQISRISSTADAVKTLEQLKVYVDKVSSETGAQANFQIEFLHK